MNPVSMKKFNASGRLSVVPCVYLALIIYIEKKDAVSFMENLLENVAPDLLEMIDEISDNIY